MPVEVLAASVTSSTPIRLTHDAATSAIYRAVAPGSSLVARSRVWAVSSRPTPHHTSTRYIRLPASQPVSSRVSHTSAYVDAAPERRASAQATAGAMRAGGLRGEAHGAD